MLTLRSGLRELDLVSGWSNSHPLLKVTLFVLGYCLLVYCTYAMPSASGLGEGSGLDCVGQC